MHKILPGWFKALFVTVMLLLCAFLCFFALEQVQLRFQVEDLTLSLDTSRQRERKQQYEYDQVVIDIPETQAQLDILTPKTEAAQAVVADLKAERTRLRQEQTDLTAQLEAVQTALADVQAQTAQVQTEIDALKEQLAASAASPAP